jgi:hypothetical protein
MEQLGRTTLVDPASVSRVSDGANLCAVYHFVHEDVVLDERYIQWISKFGPEVIVSFFSVMTIYLFHVPQLPGHQSILFCNLNFRGTQFDRRAWSQTAILELDVGKHSFTDHSKDCDLTSVLD